MEDEANQELKNINLVVTGISGYIGSRLLSRLNEVSQIGSIVGIDIKPPAIQSPKLHFYRLDVSQPLGEIFRNHHVDTAIHLAFILKPTHRKTKANLVDVGGTVNFLNACELAGVKHLFYLSSHTVYGAFQDNPSRINEDWKVRPLTGFQYSENKVKAEKLLRDFCELHAGTKLTILRSCPVIGAHASNTVSTMMMKSPLMMRIRGYDPFLQFVHEDDLLELMVTLISKSVPGIFNVSGDGEIKYSELAKLAGKKMVVVPEFLMRSLLSLSWDLHLQNESPAVGLEFIKYPPLISTSSLKAKVKFQFRYSAREAVSAYLHKSRAA